MANTLLKKKKRKSKDQTETSATIKKFHSFFSSQRDSPILHVTYPNRSSIFFNLCPSPITFAAKVETSDRFRGEETGTNLCFKDIRRNQRRSETSTDLIRQIGDTDYRELLAIPSWYSWVSLPVQNCWRKSERIEAF